MIVMLCALVPLLALLLTIGKTSVKRSLIALVLTATLCFVSSGIALGEWTQGSVLFFWDDYFISDPSSRLFLALISTVFMGVALYVFNRGMTDPFALRQIQRFVRSALLLLSMSALAVLSAHFISMWIFIEATTLCLVPLIYHQKGNSSIRAAFKYFLFSSVSLGLVYLGLICLSHADPSATNQGLSFFFRDLGSQNHALGLQPWRDLGLALIFLGFGTKLGLAPMYTWLPETYDLSPPSVTALLSAIQFNVVMLAIFRLFQFYEPLRSPVIRYELLCFGIASILVSALHMVVAKNYKRLIAYASVNHAGVIALGLGLGKEAAYGVVLYVISNALVKAILFLTCGNIKARYHTKSISELHGLIKTMPYSGTFFMVGIFALLGFAPFGSFFGELLIMKSMIEGHYYALFALFCLLMTVAFVATGRAVFPMIWGEPNHEISLRGESIYALIPKIFFIILLLSMGIYMPPSANILLQGIAETIGGHS